MSERTHELQASLGHAFARPALLDEALTHSSIAGVRGGKLDAISYERLEFLGDRVLALLVAELLLESFPQAREGVLTRRFTDLVRQQTLAAVAVSLDLGTHLKLPPNGEESVRHNPAVLADLCEAILAAIYLDGGLDAARAFVLRHWQPLVQAQAAVPKDPKTALQEWAQARAQPLPVYTVIGATGPSHRPDFRVSVQVAGREPLEGAGSSKRAAEIAAATAMLAALEGGSR